ncbi:hypothetical protein [Kitasatospora sp. NPDC057223]|uniref:hypothetical protein n=1 Tax=Kitasatospora sp. NPDC057223 TaxID=3346055 RepID=UPI00362CFBC9
MSDVPSGALAAGKPVPVCVRPGCGKPVQVAESGRGRPTLYCSRSCKSKAARAKAAQAADGGTAPVCARTAPAGPTPMLGHVTELESATRAFLAAVASDPVAAYEAFSERSQRLAARLREAAADARDEIRWPGLDPHTRELRRAGEELTAPALLARVSPQYRADTARPGTGPATHAPAPAQDPAEAFETARRAACTSPAVRFGAHDRLHDGFHAAFGDDWLVASWDDPQARDVHQLLHLGRPVGWTAPLPNGPWGRAGHIAAAHHDDRAAVILNDHATGAFAHRTVGEALEALYRRDTEHRSRVQAS